MKLPISSNLVLIYFATITSAMPSAPSHVTLFIFSHKALHVKEGKPFRLHVSFCVAASRQRPHQAFLLYTLWSFPQRLMYSTPCCHVYEALAFTVISDCCFLVVYYSRQSTNKPDCYSLHQFSPDVIIPALHHCSCLFHIPLLSLSPSLSLPSLSTSSPWHFFFSLPFFMSWPLKIPRHSCMLSLPRQGDLEGWSSEDDVLCSFFSPLH